MQDKRYNKNSQWNHALTDAQVKLSEGKLYVARIRAAIKVLKKKRDAGEPWPVNEKTGIDAESIPA